MIDSGFVCLAVCLLAACSGFLLDGVANSVLWIVGRLQRIASPEE